MTRAGVADRGLKCVRGRWLFLGNSGAGQIVQSGQGKDRAIVSRSGKGADVDGHGVKME